MYNQRPSPDCTWYNCVYLYCICTVFLQSYMYVQFIHVYMVHVTRVCPLIDLEINIRPQLLKPDKMKVLLNK